MTYGEAIHFCEENECEDCPANYLPDCRTDLERQHFHYPCCINLVDETVRSHLRQAWRRRWKLKDDFLGEEA